MLKLAPEQLDLLEQLQVRRIATSMAAQLAETWPAVTARLTERWPAFVEAAMQQARRHGVTDTADLARWVSLWCLWGANFDERPGFEWARDILADRRRRPYVKVHQLLARTREELRAMPPPRPGAAPGPTLASWDATLGRLTQGNNRARDAASAFIVDDPPAPKAACDLGVVDLKLVDAADHHEYRPVQGGWLRQSAPPPAPLLVHLDSQPDAPLSISALGRAGRTAAAARLNLRVQPLAVCDSRQHPELVLNGPSGAQRWAGRDVMQLVLPLASAPEPEVLAGIAHAVPALDYEVALRSCGLRDRGAPFEAVALQAHIHPATQWLFNLQNPPAPEMQWPAGAAEPAAPPRLALERDGTALPVPAWSAAWAELPGRLHAGFEKVYNAFAKCMAGGAGSTIGVRALVGSAVVTWGARRTESDTVVQRVEGQLDLAAFEIEGQLAGEVVCGGSRARLRLLLSGRAELKQTIQQGAGAKAEGQALSDATRAFKIPFALEVDPLHDGSLALLCAGTPEPGQLGGLSGQAGLRPRDDGLGFEWFLTLKLEPGAAPLVLLDPICGRTALTLPLLPELPLVDWKAG